MHGFPPIRLGLAFINAGAQRKAIRAGGRDSFAENSSAPGRSQAKAEFHTSRMPPKHGQPRQGPESHLCPPGGSLGGRRGSLGAGGARRSIAWAGRPVKKKHQLGACSIEGKGLTPESPRCFWQRRAGRPPKVFTEPNPAGRVGPGGRTGSRGSRNGGGC